MNKKKVSLKHLAKVKELRQNIANTLRSLAKVIDHSIHKQIILDLITRLGPDNFGLSGVLPAQATGFVVRCQSERSKREIQILCERQIVTMLITYFWLFCQTEDTQDLRSVIRYKNWLDRYTQDKKSYEVCGTIRHGYWLCDTSKIKKGDEPTLPSWLNENGGETV